MRGLKLKLLTCPLEAFFINPALFPGYHDLLNKVWRDKKKTLFVKFCRNPGSIATRGILDLFILIIILLSFLGNVTKDILGLSFLIIIFIYYAIPICVPNRGYIYISSLSLIRESAELGF